MYKYFLHVFCLVENWYQWKPEEAIGSSGTVISRYLWVTMWVGTEVRPFARAEFLYAFCCWEECCDQKPFEREFISSYASRSVHHRKQSGQNLIAAESETEIMEECCMLFCFQCSDSASFIILNYMPPQISILLCSYPTGTCLLSKIYCVHMQMNNSDSSFLSCKSSLLFSSPW